MLADGVLGAARRQCCVVRIEHAASNFGAQVELLSGPHVPMMDGLVVFARGLSLFGAGVLGLPGPPRRSIRTGADRRRGAEASDYKGGVGHRTEPAAVADERPRRSRRIRLEPGAQPGSVAVVDSAGLRAYTPLQRWNCNVANDPMIDDAVDPQRGLQ